MSGSIFTLSFLFSFSSPFASPHALPSSPSFLFSSQEAKQAMSVKHPDPYHPASAHASPPHILLQLIQTAPQDPSNPHAPIPPHAHPINPYKIQTPTMPYSLPCLLLR